MKLMIASDLHGSGYYTERLLGLFESEEADRLLLLGDLLYHGPRNPLPKGYSPQLTANTLNSIKEKLICVRGNCDAEVDQLLLEFPIMAEDMWLLTDEVSIFATHGHKFNKENLPPMPKGSVLLHGHTHLPAMEQIGDHYYLNPGSLSLPKEDNLPSYLIYEKGVFTLKGLDGCRLQEMKIK